MSKSSLLFLTLYFLFLISSLIVTPCYGLICYIFTYFNLNEKVSWWLKDIPALRWNMIAFCVTVLSMYLHRDSLSNIKIIKDTNYKWLILWFLLMLLMLPLSVDMDASLKYLYNFFRYILIFPIFLKIISSTEKFLKIIWFYLASCFYLSIKAYTIGSRIQGRLEGIGPPDASDANMFAALLITTIPFLISSILKANYKIRLISLLFMLFILNAIVLCSSRGAFLGLTSAMVIMIYLENDKKIRNYLLCCVVIVAGLFYFLLDSAYIDRLTTLTNTPVKSHHFGRGQVWLYGLRIVKDYPFGTGAGGFQFLSSFYLPSELLAKATGTRAAHNTYLKILVEHGWIGLILFFLFIYSTFLTLYKTRQDCLSRNGILLSGEIEYIYIQAGATIAALTGLLVCSIFIDRIYFEPLYWLCAFAPILKHLYQTV